MEKYILLTQCAEPFYGNTANVYENKEKAIKRLKEKEFLCQFAELYKADLIKKTKYERDFF